MTIRTLGAPHGSLTKLRAHWVTRDTFLWKVVGSPKHHYSLIFSPDATLSLTADDVTGGIEAPLTVSEAGPGGDVFKRFPHLAGYSAFKVAGDVAAKAPEMLKGQLVLMARDGSGKLVDAAGVQIPGVLDDLYHYPGPLGVTWDGQTPSVRVWAPTARKVSLELFASSQAATGAEQVMAYDSASGVWSVNGLPDWKNNFYLFAVDVYVPATGKVEHNVVTDPYSYSLSVDSKRSQIVDWGDASLAPEGWANLAKPVLAAPEDSVIYELHIRDFSASDESVPAALRGTFDAFTIAGSNGMRHLKALAAAGLTHVHLLPAFDFATVEEDRTKWVTVPDAALIHLPPDSDQQQLLLAPTRETDGFNWGYDPYHYNVPEGSYSTAPDGPQRIKEFRSMIQALNQAGLRVVMDVVYNHTAASGQADKSVFDRIVPGYYYRLDGDGQVETSTCCENTASEHTMMGKLLIDSVLTWATQYKVDGFRFDLMGHHMLANMTALRSAIDSLTAARDGVDGQAIYVYGEGWDFGEVAQNARGVNASQQNIGGTGIGVFNDRLRDGVRGGNPFDPLQLQGFVTGLALQPNGAETRPAADQRSTLLEYKDWIKAGLAGNLSDFPLVDGLGNAKPANNLHYEGKPVGYTRDPQENVVYVSAHDNETLFDAIQVKAAEAATMTDRVRMNNLALDLVMLSQGVPFFHAGDDLLRSKSLDRNSYDSGDWFNKLDFTFGSDNWGAGLPPDSESNWPIFQPLLANPALKPGPADILFAAAHFQTMLRVRRSSPLFRLRTGDQILRTLAFLNNGPEQIPGLIAMALTDIDNLDPNLDALLVLFNAAPAAVAYAGPGFKGHDWRPYDPLFVDTADPVLQEARFDSTTGTFTLPARTTVIFAKPESGMSAGSQAATAGATAE
jgi:pullulanase